MISKINNFQTLLEAVDQKERFEGIRRNAQKKQKDLTQDLQDISAGNFSFKTLFSSKPKEQVISEIHTQIANVKNV